MRQRLINLDVNAGRLIRLHLPAYIQERYLSDGSGVYSREEWSKARALGYRDAGIDSVQLDTDEAYLRRLFSAHAYNLHAALRLARTYDFSPHRSVIELGCGEMIQAYVLTNVFPHLRYKATDFDPYIIDKCAKLPLLQGIEKAMLDVSTLTPDDIAGFDLVISWELLYALDETKLTTLFRGLSSAGVPMLVCTSQLTGPVRSLWRGVKNLNWRPAGFYYERMARAGRLRRHGWNPSLGYYDRVAQSSGMRLARVWMPPCDQAWVERFTYLLFKPTIP